MKATMSVLKVIAGQALLLLVGLICIELALRTFFPLPHPGGVFLDRDGNQVGIASSDVVLRPNLDVTHVTSEFSKRVRTNALGYRWMDNVSLKPEYLFLGDSFTFGHGASDAETFAELFCGRNHFSCQNLGYSGSDTFDEVRILRYALEHYGMRPNNVVIVMLAACWLDMAGNDLGDNLTDFFKLSGTDDSRNRSTPVLTALAHSALRHQLEGLEMTRRAMLLFSRQMKDTLYRCADGEKLDAAVEATRFALGKLQGLAAEYRFAVRLVVVHPYPDLHGGFVTTEDAVRRAAPPDFALVFTGAEFRDEDYYPYDGHFNPQGHAKMAAILQRRLLGTIRALPAAAEAP